MVIFLLEFHWTHSDYELHIELKALWWCIVIALRGGF